MIRAYLNSVEIKLFPEMAIGVTVENFNLSDLANRKLDRTNIIRVPKAGNETTFEFSSHPNAPTTFAYDDYDFDLIVDGIAIYSNAKAFIMREDEDSYTLHITNGLDIVNQMKGISLNTLFAGQEITIGPPAFLVIYIVPGINGIKVDYLYNPKEIIYCAANPDSYYWYIGESFLSMYISIIFARVAATSGITFDGALMTDADFLKMRIPLVAGLLIKPNGETDIVATDMVINRSLNFYDLFKIVVQLFGAVFKISGSTITIQKFDDIDKTTTLNWTGKMVSKSKLFTIPSAAQNNLIRYTPKEDVVDSYLQTTLVCNNLRLEKEKVLFQIKSNIYPFVGISTYYTTSNGIGIDLPDFKIRAAALFGGIQMIEKSLEKLAILVDSTDVISTGNIDITIEYMDEVAPMTFVKASTNHPTLANDLELPQYYDFSGNFVEIRAMLTNPVFYEAELLLNILDIYEFTEPAIIPSNISDCENSPGYPYETFSGVSPTGFTAVNTVDAGQCGTADEIPFVNGEKWTVTFDLVLNSGALPYVRGCISIDGSCFAGNFQAVEGANEIIFFPTSTYVGVIRFSNNTATDYVISNLAVRKGSGSFRAVRIDELEGVFYVNKIINFLATSPGTPTKVELIKIS